MTKQSSSQAYDMYGPQRDSGVVQERKKRAQEAN